MSCLVDLSMKKSSITFGPDLGLIIRHFDCIVKEK